MSTPDLAARLARAWEDHAAQPEAVAALLDELAPGLPPDADGAEAVRLAEHVWLAHLQREAGLSGFLARLTAPVAASPEAGPLVQRAQWVLATLAGRPAPEVGEAVRWRGLHSLWSVWAARGGAADAQAMLAAELPAALAHGDATARRALAATCNNLASELREGPRGDAARDRLMLQAAEAARALWASAGTWVHTERADYLLARCHATLGQGAQALAHAQACLAAIDAHADAPEADATERFFAHEAVAWSQLAAGDAAAAQAAHARMAALLGTITDDGLAAWCRDTLAQVGAALR